MIGAIFGIIFIGATFTSLAGLQWGSAGALVVGLLMATVAMGFAALVIYGRRRLDEASRLINRMP